MKSGFLFVWLCMGFIGAAGAEIYKSIDAEGRVTYSSTPSKGAKKLGLEPQSQKTAVNHESVTHAVRPRSISSPADFPRVDSSTQKSRDSTRRRILMDELTTEEKLLAEARGSLLQAEGGGKGQKAEAVLHAEVTLHEKNVSALKTELANVK